jgi:hypothetical protein
MTGAISANIPRILSFRFKKKKRNPVQNKTREKIDEPLEITIQR